MHNLYANIIVNNIRHSLDKPFQYLVPSDLQNKIAVGSLVQIPFNNYHTFGYVIELTNRQLFSPLKPIKAILDPLLSLSKEEMDLSDWLSDYYLTSRIRALRLFIPGKISNILRQLQRIPRQDYRTLRAMLTMDFKTAQERLSVLSTRAPKQGELFEIILGGYDSSVQQLLKESNLDFRVLNRLVERGFVTLVPLESKSIGGVKELALNTRQLEAVQTIVRNIQAMRYQPYLLFGVTASGKTEVYIRIMKYCLKNGLQSILLLPEISLTMQIVERLRIHFGDEIVLFHSKLTETERFEAWKAVKLGHKKIIVGARSAVFAPVKKLGVIILDEEHDNSYKQENDPRYHAKDVAIKRGMWHNCPVIFGSATPSLETFYASQRGRIEILSLPNRIKNIKLPAVEVVDMKDELRAGNYSVFSFKLRAAIEEALAGDNQVMLYLNRRGFASFVLCRSCGFVPKCVNCEVSLTYHQKENVLLCHYCGYKLYLPPLCPKCKSSYWRPFGMGTEKVETEFKKLYPEVPIARIDGDTASKKDLVSSYLKEFAEYKLKVLVGTQMIAKGLDFPRVTLVGVISADTTLNLPDFRSREKSFQLLTQVAGRAGRDLWEGKVIIQTYNPEDISIEHAKNQDYLAFYRHELAFRKQCKYPPFSQVIRVVVAGTDHEVVFKGAQILKTYIEPRSSEFEMLGPSPCGISKLKRRFRWNIILKAPRAYALKTFLADRIEMYYTEEAIAKKLQIFVDVNPNNFM